MPYIEPGLARINTKEAMLMSLDVLGMHLAFIGIAVLFPLHINLIPGDSPGYFFAQRIKFPPK
jgi:hypothetical protein